MTPVSFTAPAADPSEIDLDPSSADDDPTPDLDAGSATAAVSLPEPAVALARAAAVEEAGNSALIGEYLGASREDDVAVTAAFAAADRGYLGWYWSVTLAVVGLGTDEAAPATVSEVVLLPGQQALLAPVWVPWDRRIRAGDVGVGDLLPTAPDDIRLVPGYVDSDDPAVKEVAYEFGLGRVRVLSREGRDEAAQRWHDGPFGPEDTVAQQAPANCITCGFYVPLAGLLGMALGACSNEYSPADGRVVDAEYGCGAHSETVIDAPLMSASTDTVVDELTLEVHRRPTTGSGVDVLDPDADLVDADLVVVDAVGGDLVDADLVVVDAVGGDLVDAEVLDAVDGDLVDADMVEDEADVAEPEVVDADLVEVEVADADGPAEPLMTPENDAVPDPPSSAEPAPESESGQHGTDQSDPNP